MTTVQKSPLFKALGGFEGINKLSGNARLYAVAGVARQLGNHQAADALVQMAMDRYKNKGPKSEEMQK